MEATHKAANLASFNDKKIIIQTEQIPSAVESVNLTNLQLITLI